VAMEATGIYWHAPSDGEFKHAGHVRNVPGRKTEVNDAVWLEGHLAHGLIRASFVPDGPTPSAPCCSASTGNPAPAEATLRRDVKGPAI
jgi:hypothetical protein